MKDEMKNYYPSLMIIPSILVLTIGEVILFKISGGVFRVLWILPILHFLFLYKDYRICFGVKNIKLYSVTKGIKNINLEDIETVQITDSKIEHGAMGPIKMLYIYTKNGSVKFDIYRFDNEKIEKEFIVLAELYNFKVVEF